MNETVCDRCIAINCSSRDKGYDKCDKAQYVKKEDKMKDTAKLYRVTLRGMTTSTTGVAFGISYVIAKNTDEAYNKVRDFLDKEDRGFTQYRELDKIELLAENYPYTDTKTMLFI